MVVSYDMFPFSTWTIAVVICIVSHAVCNDVYVLKGGNGVIPCAKVDGIDLSNTSKYQLNSDRIIVINIDNTDIHDYTCSDKKTIYRFLIGSNPELNFVFQERSYFIGDTMKLTCSFTGIPQVQVTWVKDRTLISGLISTHEGETGTVQSTLVKKSVESLDEGVYKCIGRNKFDQVEHEKRIKIYYKLEKLQLTTANLTSQKVLIRWNRSTALTYVDPDHYLKINVYKDGRRIRIADVAPKTGVFQNSFLFANLSPYTEYIFQAVEGFNKDTDIESNELRVTTLQDAPSKPRDVQVTSYKTSIRITWREPSNLNGIITAYLVEYYYYNDGGKAVEEVLDLDATQKEVELKNLYSAVTYYIQLSAKTIKYSDKVNKEIRTIDGVPHVPPGNLSLVNIDATTVNVSWNSIPKYLQGGTVTQYFLEYILSFEINKIRPNSSYIPSGTLYMVISGLKSYKSYQFSIAAYTKNGVGPKNSKDITTLEGRPTPPLDVKVKVVRHGSGEQSISINWKEPQTTNGKPMQFQVVYRKLRICRKERCAREMTINKDYYDKVNFTNSKQRGHLISKSLDPFSLYSIKVREATNSGWGEYSKTVEIMTQMGKPSEPQNVTHTDISDDSITIKWNTPRHENGIITDYNIIIQKGFNDEVAYNLKVTTSKSLFTFTFSNNIQAETTYSIRVKAVNTDSNGNKYKGRESETLIVTTTAASKFPWMFILVGCLAVILLIALIIAVVLLVRRQRLRYKEVKTTEDVPLVGICRSRPIAVEELKQYCAQQHANSDHGFQQEYESIRIPVTTFTWEYSLMPANQSKNRYSNIVAYDHSRVILSVIDNSIHSDYINASYIDGYKKVKKYIATQGPLPETVIDFWRMVWEQESNIIVMLTKLVEDGRVKCEQYWPEGPGLQYRDIVVTVNSVSEMTDNTVRVFTLHKVSEPNIRREVRQFHYTAWPDHGVPSHPTSLLSFIRHVMSYMDTMKAPPPIIVHCSAGVGRTGTFITIESCLRQIASENMVDVFGHVYKMRMNRNLMVQVEPQYTLIYNALLDSVVCGNTAIPPADLVSKIHHLKKENPGTGETHFSAEFKRLETGSGSTEKNKYGDANQPENKQKNRFLNILPFDSNRVRLQPVAGVRHSDYINASIIDGFQQRDAFIAGQAPLENTVNDFWRMLMEQNVHIIVMLTKLEERGQEKCYLYWPQAGTVSYGIIHVELVNVRSEDENSLVINEFRLTNGETGRSWTVTQYMYLGWPEYGSPESGSELIHLIGSVQQAYRLVSDSGPILVHCSGGVGRTGVFIAVYNSIERLKAKDVVDVFQTIRQLRLQRTAMVQTIDQYQFCYQALLDYLASFHLYANCIVNVKV